LIALKWAFAASFTAGLAMTAVAARAWRARRPHAVPPTQEEQDALAVSRQDAEGGPPRHDLPAPAVAARRPLAWTNAQLRAWLDPSPR
jgi:hypothetical protein